MNCPYPFDPATVAPRLLAWYGTHGPRPPLAAHPCPYRIWLSEIMLQQTTVTAVIPFYQRFLDASPTLPPWAAAPPARVIELCLSALFVASVPVFRRASGPDSSRLAAAAARICQPFCIARKRKPLDPVD